MSAIIRELFARARHQPRTEALRSETRALSYAGLADRVAVTASQFESRQVQRLGLMADNGLDWIVADLAALHAGVTLIPLPPFFTAAQLEFVVDAAGIDTLAMDELAPRRPANAAGFRPAGSIGDGLTMLVRPGSIEPVAAGVQAAKITFTSGSTGQPKGVALSTQSLDDVAERLLAALDNPGIRNHLCVSPLALLLENIAGVYLPLMLGASVHAPPLSALGLYGSSRPDIRRFVETIRCTNAESLILTPQLLRDLTAACREEAMSLDTLRFVAVGGARVAEADIQAANAAGIPACQGYGLSECASVVAINRPGDSRPGSVGRALPGIDIAIAADGEILVANQRMLGYLGEESDPAESRPFPTGDLGHLDKDGFLYVTGRKRNVFINSFGRNVSPEWPEAELLHESSIAQACVFGEGRPFNTAVLVPASQRITSGEIERSVQRANERLPDYARIGEWILAERFSPSNGLLTPTGKLCRHAIELRYLLTDDLARPAAGLRHQTDSINTRTKDYP